MALTREPGSSNESSKDVGLSLEDVENGSEIGNLWRFDVFLGNIEFVIESEIDVGTHDPDAVCLHTNVSDSV